MRWAIITGMYNVADLVEAFCAYHLDLGVDQIFVSDYGSDDGTLDLLHPFLRSGAVRLFPLSTHHFATYDPSNAVLQKVREDDLADWISFLDPDEFLVGSSEVKTSLERLCSQGVAALAVPRFNLLGMGRLPAQRHYLRHLTLKVIATDQRSSSPSAILSSPWIFSRLPPKIMTAVKAGLTIATGDHDIAGNATPVAQSDNLEILHLPIRGYESFARKIADTQKYLAANPEFGPGTGWHWRRWIDLANRGELREEYEAQFLSPETAAALMTEGKLIQEHRLANWLRHQ